jgi:TrmH family RNA methyltransferase
MHLTKNQHKTINSLQIKKYRTKQKRYVIEGYKLVREALDNNADFDYAVYSKKILEKGKYKQLVDDLVKAKIKILWVSEGEIKKLSSFETSDGIMAVMRMEDKQGLLKSTRDLVDIVVCLDNISDPGNMGTIIRTCDWFGVKTVVCAENCVDIYNPKVIRGTMGSLYHLNVVSNVDLVDQLDRFKGREYTIVGTSLMAKHVLRNKKQVTSNNLVVICFGNETFGLSKEVEQKCDTLVKIEKYGRAESLNVGVACGILLQRLVDRD